MKATRSDRLETWKYVVIALGVAGLVGLGVPAMSKMPYSLIAIGIGPALFAFWNPEILVVLLQDALGILRIFTGSVGLDVESGFAMATMAAATAGYAFMAFRHRMNFRALLSPIAILNYGMAAVLVVALMSSGGSQYGMQKLTGFVAFNILSFMLTSITPPERRRRLLYAFVLVGLIALVSVVFGTASETAMRRAGFGGNPIWMARLLCAAALILLFGIEGSLIIRLPVAGILIAASIFTGSRGPLLVTAVVIVLALLMKASLARDRESAGASLVLVGLLMVGAGVGLAGLRIVAEQQAATNARSPFVRVFYGGESAQSSSSARVDLYETSLAVFGENPMLGAGLGGLVGEFEESENIYSHNLLLEIASETGLVGLLIHLVTVLLTVLLVIRYLHSPDAQVRQDLEIGLLMLIFCYANAQLSGDLVGNKMVWFFLGFINGTLPAWRSSPDNARVAVHRRRRPQMLSRITGKQ